MRKETKDKIWKTIAIIIQVAFYIGIIWLIALGIDNHYKEKADNRREEIQRAKDRCLKDYRHCEYEFEELYNNLF